MRNDYILKKNEMKKCLILLLTVGFSQISKGEEFIGSVINYKAVSSLKYQVEYKIYSDEFPDGVKDLTPLLPMTFKVISGKNSVQHSPLLVSTASFVDFFKTNRGCKEYIYTDTIDLNNTQFTSIKNSGDCKVYFSVYYPKRYEKLTNISASPYFSYSYIDICLAPLNNSTIIGDFKTYIPENALIPANNFYFDMDADSLGFSLMNPNNDFNSDIQFNAGYSLIKNFDSDTMFFGDFGELFISPKSADSNYAVVVEVKEFRNIGGQNREIGGVRHDFVVKVIKNINNPPIINGPYHYTVNAGQQICFNINTDDKSFIPPAPNVANPPDTVVLTWNRAIPGATFTIINPEDRLLTGRFCWTPNLSDVRALPYTFNATAIDNCWLLSDRTVNTFSIQVNSPINSITKLNPYNIIVYPNPIQNQMLSISGFAMEEVMLQGSSGNVISKWKAPQSNRFEKDLSELSSGIYFVSVSANGFIYQTKFIKP